MTDCTTLEFAEEIAATRELRRGLAEAIEASKDEKVGELARELADVRIVGAVRDAPPLTIAFVGQYNAGKSTIVRVLTGREDIVIDSDVCTDAVTAYDWNGVCLLDTPGVHAGYEDHDETTYAVIDRADLLVFVVTNELFDATIGRHFRELAFARQHACRMLLVVNKMGQDAGSTDTKRAAIEQVTVPLTLADFRGVFVDARSWLEAQDAEEEDREELLEIANVGVLISSLNAFIAAQGLSGRLLAPLFTMAGIAEHASALLSTDFPQERAALELLHRKRGLFLSSRARLRSGIGGLVARAVADISSYGDEVAESIEPGTTDAQVSARHNAAQQRASERCDGLRAEVNEAVEAELAELRRQLEALRDGVLARELRGQVEGDAPPAGELTTPRWEVRSKAEVLKDWPAKAKKIGNVAKEIGDWSARWATGPAKTAAFGSSAAARGSNAHRVVYDVGKFFGAKFRPWGAVKVARTIGNAGRFISAVAGVLAVVGQIAEDRQQEKVRLQLRDARDGVRTAYRDSARAVQDALWEQFEGFNRDFYASELGALDETVESLVGKRSDREDEAKVFQALLQRTVDLIQRISTKRLPATNA